MPDLTVGQAVERLSHTLIYVRNGDLPRALRLALGQARFTDFVMRCGSHLMTDDMKLVVRCYQAQLDQAQMVDRALSEWQTHTLTKEAKHETT